MNIRWGESPDSGQMTENPRSTKLKYVLEGIFDKAVARAYAVAATPLIYDGLFRQDVQVDSGGFRIWRVTVPYGPEKQQKPGEYKWSVDTTGGTSHITSAKTHGTDYAPSGKTAPNHGGAIGVKQSGGTMTVEGCDIIVPACKWTETWSLPKTAASFSYIDTLEALTGRVNASTFRGKPAGEVRFDGATGGGSTADPDAVEFTFHFTRNKSVTNLTIDNITGINATGWQYLWIEYEQQADTNSNTGVQRAMAVHVETVYDSENFAILGIGTGSIT
jgi:hypothetical protein